MIGKEPNLIKKYGVKPKNVEEIKENIQMRFKRKLNHLIDLDLIKKAAPDHRRREGYGYCSPLQVHRIWVPFGLDY